MSSRFANYFTNSQHYWQWLRSSYIQATIQNVSAEKYANLMVTAPPVQEQAEIVEYLDSLSGQIEAIVNTVRSSIEKLFEYRTALISAAVTGKIDVRGEVPAD